MCLLQDRPASSFRLILVPTTDYAENAVAPSFSSPVTPTENFVQDVLTG